MKLEQGKTYRVRLTSGAWTDAVFLEAETLGGYDVNPTYAPSRHIRKRTLYQFRNLRTGRSITLRSMRKVKAIEVGA